MNETAETEAAFPSAWPSTGFQQARYERQGHLPVKRNVSVRIKRGTEVQSQMLTAVFSVSWDFNCLFLSSFKNLSLGWWQSRWELSPLVHAPNWDT